MSAVAAAIGGAAVIGLVGSSISSQNAANSQTQAADAANQQQWKEFQQQQANQQPWLDAGKTALGSLQSQLPDLQRSFTSNDFHQDPGYQFTLNQGLQAMQRSAAAKGGLDSMGTMQNLNNYAQGSASNEYQNAYNRFTQNQQQRYNMLAGIANTGQVANGQLGQAGMNMANQVGNNMMGAGNAAAAGSIAQGNAFNNALSTGANSYMNMSMMNKMFPQQQAPMSGGYGGGFNGSSNMSMPEFGSSAVAPAPSYSLLSE